MAAVTVAVVIRLWLLRRVEERLLHDRQALENLVLQQQKELLQARQDGQAWRGEIERQFDHYRHMASAQLDVEQARFNELLARTAQRERELQSELALARQMCTDLPHAQARVLYLESMLSVPDLSLAEPRPGAVNPAFTAPLSYSVEPPPVPLISPKRQLPPLPALSDGPGTTVPASLAPVPEPSLDERLLFAERQNQHLRQALAAARLRGRRTRSQPLRIKHRGGK